MDKTSQQLIKIAKIIRANYNLNKITDQDFNKLSYEVYHATPYFNFENIIKNGLGIDTNYMNNKKGFFFATDEDNAQMYGNYEGERTVIFAIQTSKLDNNKIYYDQNDCYTDAYVTLLKGQQYSWQNYDEDLDDYTPEKYWKTHYSNMCFFYDGVVEVSEENII